MREMIQLYAYFGDLVRIDLQRQVAKLRDKAVPAQGRALPGSIHQQDGEAALQGAAPGHEPKLVLE